MLSEDAGYKAPIRGDFPARITPLSYADRRPDKQTKAAPYTMTSYGTQEPLHPLNELLGYAGNPTEYKYILFHPQIPHGSKQCQWPGSWKVQLVMLNDRVFTATRLLDGLVQFKGL